MKAVISIFLVLAGSAMVSAQSTDLPQILVPSDYSKQEANRLDAQVFKILPRYLPNKNYEAARNDSEAVLGIRGNGAAYSFSTKTHSFNNIAEILLESGQFQLWSPLSFIADLGSNKLSNITVETEMPVLKFLLFYEPPVTDQEIEQERKIHNRKIGGIQLSESVPAILGRTYLMRSIRPEKADILVAFTVIRAENDGSLEIAWKVLKQFVKPSKLYLSDVDLRLALQRIINDNDIFKTVAFEVKDSEITLTGHTSRREFEIFMAAVAPIRTRQIHSSLVEDK